MRYDLSERVVILPNNLSGRVIGIFQYPEGVKYSILLDDPDKTEDGLYYAEESELRKPKE